MAKAVLVDYTTFTGVIIWLL